MSSSFLLRGGACHPHLSRAQEGNGRIFKAVSEGEKEFDAISVVTDNGGSPCGGCRQVLAEFGLDTIVLMADKNGTLVK